MGNRIYIPDKLKKIMAARSGGRCQLCSVYLFKDVFGNNSDLSELAHNIPYSEKGPRSSSKDGDIAPKYKMLFENKGYNADNLLVLCPNCHKAIDSDPVKYTVDYLTKLKASRERAILEAGTKLIETKAAIKFTSPIAGRIVSISDDEIKDALFKEYKIVDNFVLDLSNEIVQNNETYCEYLSAISKQLEKLFKQKVESSMNENSKGFVLFGFTPQPLLIKFGTLFNNYHNVEIRERSRTTGWSWKGESTLEFEIIPPKEKDNTRSKISLLLEISAPLKENEISETNTDIWRISVIGEKTVDLIGSNNDLERFEKIVYRFFSMIKEIYGADIAIDVYPAMSISLAIKFGAIYMPNAFNKITIFDKIKDSKGDPTFVKALDIF